MAKEDRRPTLRPANNKDRRAIKKLVYEVLEEYGLMPDPDATDADINDIDSAYFKRGGVFYVLEESDGAAIGCYGLYPLGHQACELRKMYLVRAHRGKGLGRFMLEEALARARRMEFTTVVLETASVLKEAIDLYESYGFRQYEPEHISSRCDRAYRLELK
ncbi:MAG: GNAT family N-acetyltransferase [Phycisphaerales bacterium]|nr:MAG: GNAT family N-acetyltransferase [Phycisphaerales bacterium]